MTIQVNKLTIFLLSIFNIIFTQVNLSFDGASINAGDSFTTNVSLENPNDNIGGFQFVLTDFPDQLDLVNVVATERTEHMMIQFEPTTNVVIAFDLTGVGVVEGDGPVLVVTLESNSIYTNSINLGFADYYISDLDGNPVDVTITEGVVEVSGEDPPPIFPPADLVGTGGYQNVNLSWSHPNPEEVVGYRIYQEGAFIGESELPTYTAIGLETLVEYCFTVTAFDNFVESEPSNEACATTVDQYFEVAQNLTASVDGLEVSLDWDTPEGFLAIGQPCDEGCTDPYGGCIFDCNLQCVSANTVASWTGDGLCDDGTWNIFLNCDEFDCDGGDCLDPYTGECAEDTYYSSPADIPANDKIAYEIESVNNNPRIELLHYEVFRDNELIGTTENTGYVDDSGLDYLNTYCYNVTAVYDEGTSGYSNTACVETVLSPPQNLFATPGPGHLLLSWQPHPDNEQDEFNIYKDDVLLTTVTGTEFIDMEVNHNTEYCYTVTAVYDLGESGPSNMACSQWDLMTPLGLSTQTGDGTALLTWEEPGTNLCADEMISQLPFNDVGTNIGMGDDWLVQGSQGADYAYMLSLNSQTTLDVSVCSGLTDYDPKIEIFTANAECVETTTGHYNDDNTCEFSGLHSSLLGVQLAPGTYYIVVDGFGGQEGNYELNVTVSGFVEAIEPPIVQDNIDYEGQKSGQEIQIEDWNYADNGNHATRNILNYNIYRDNAFLASVDSDVFEYEDTGLTNLTEYCYEVTAMYEEGESEGSNQSCVIPIPGIAPSNLDVVGGAGGIDLTWTEGSPSLTDYNIYRNEEGGDPQLIDVTTTNSYSDNSAVPNVVYCYQVTANYPSGESLPTNSDCDYWELYEPADLSASPGDGVVHLAWGEPVGGPEIGEPCEEGCQPDWEGNLNCVYDCLMQCVSATTVEAWTGDSVCDAGGWGIYLNCDYFNCDGGDCIDPYTGECAPNEYGNEQPEITTDQELDREYYHVEYTVPYNHVGRDLTGYDIYRDNSNEPIAHVGANVEQYDDEEVVNHTEYCYHIVATYDEGESLPTEDVCAVPTPGLAPTELYAVGEGGQIHLTWNAGGQGLIEYNIYRNGSFLATSNQSEYFDSTAEHDVEYCYIVTGVYPSGESLPSNEACGMWILAAPLGVTTTPGNGFIELNWSEPGTNLCADAVISQLPYNDVGSTVGLSDDWLVQGWEWDSQGADYSYMLTLGSTTTIDVTLCSMTTDYDTKLEIFTADDECVESTTGHYVDDDYENCPDFVAPYPPSGLWGVTLNPGTYYIVVDGYGGDQGNYEINVSESVVAHASTQPSIRESIRYESTKAGVDINPNDWLIADGQNYSGEPIQIEERNLLNFQIFRDDNEIAMVEPNVFNYVDNGLENGTEYCYHIVAHYEQGISQPTPEICDAPDAGPMCPPENLVLDDEVGQDYIGLTWDAPDGNCQGAFVVSGEGANEGIGSECITFENLPGVTDCIGFCFSNEHLNWINDGWCDDGQFGIDLLCEEWEWDQGDCDGDGIGHTEKLAVDNSGFEPVDVRDRLEGYNIYKDNEFIFYTLETYYYDQNIDFDQEYCYKVKAVYSEGESNPTTTECGTVPDPAGYSVLAGPNFDMPAGGETTFTIDLENQEPVAGFQFTLTPNPNLITFGSVELTPRSEGFLLETNIQEDGSLIVVGFDISGNPMQIGEGPILEVSCTSDFVLSPQDVNMVFSDVFIGNPLGDPLDLFANTGTITLVPEGAIELSLSGGELNTGEEIVIEVSLANDVAVGSFQIYIKDTPDVVSFIDLETTDRTEGFVINGDEVDNDLILVGFGDVIQPGNGSIMNLTFQGITSGTAELDIFDVMFSDVDENPIPVITYSSDITVTTIVSVNIEMDPMMQNLVSFGVIPESNNIESILSGTNVLVVSNDNSQWYVPSFAVNQINNLGTVEGYRAIIGGMETEVVAMSGEPIDPNEVLILEPNKINLLPFYSFNPMTIPEVFNGMEDDILLVKNDQGEYYIPSIGEMSLTHMYFGEAYQVYLTGDEEIEFTYPSGSLASYMDLDNYRDIFESRKTNHYPQMNTGISHPIIINNMNGNFKVGDEIGAYANGEFVGGAKITNPNSLFIVASGGFDSYGIELDGYEVGDEIELRLWSNELKRELRIDSQFDSPYFGIQPMSKGSVNVIEMDAIPQKYILGQNYPNPFNPNTNIEFAIPEETYINLSVYDIMGRLVKTLVDGKLNAGYHQVVWDGTDIDSLNVSASLYIYVLKNNKVTITKKMVMMK